MFHDIPVFAVLAAPQPIPVLLDVVPDELFQFNPPVLVLLLSPPQFIPPVLAGAGALLFQLTVPLPVFAGIPQPVDAGWGSDFGGELLNRSVRWAYLSPPAKD